MGYYVNAYILDAAKLESLYGSKDSATLSTLQNEFSDALDSLNEDFSFDKQLDKHRNAQEILKDMVNGQTRFPELAYMYGYVYEKLCEHYGERIEAEEEFSSRYFWAVEKPGNKAFIPIPFSDDFPEIYSIAKSELETERTRFTSLETRDGVDAETFALEQEDYAAIFDEAIEKGRDLVLFLC